MERALGFSLRVGFAGRKISYILIDNHFPEWQDNLPWTLKFNLPRCFQGGRPNFLKFREMAREGSVNLPLPRNCERNETRTRKEA
jgi:hypothetical protein